MPSCGMHVNLLDRMRDACQWCVDMTAEEALELSNTNKGPIIDAFADYALARIRIAALRGESWVYKPFSSLRGTGPSRDQKRLVWDLLQKQGFKSIQIADEQDPCDGICW